MQREIKFRGRSIDTKEWVYGFLYINSNDRRTFVLVDGDLTEDFTAVEVIPETVGQYTELKDKNGKDIYEGDILCDSLGWVFAVKWDSDNARFLGYHTKPRGNTYICYVGREPKVEFIGNIYENPDLLKE